METFSEPDTVVKLRVARYRDGICVIQGLYPIKPGYTTGWEWVELPLVDLDVWGNEIETPDYL